MTLTARNEVVQLVVRGDSVREVRRWPTVRQPDTVAAQGAGGCLFVTGTAGAQLTGNLALLAAPAALLVARWPALGRPLLLAALGLSAGTSIELLQWALPLGRVVSPLDAVLNATGALAAGLLAARLLRSPGRHGRMALPT